MAEQVKWLAIESDDLRWLPGLHLVERENDSSKLSSDLHICTMACMVIFKKKTTINSIVLARLGTEQCPFA